jgi:hypothetical protein
MACEGGLTIVRTEIHPDGRIILVHRKRNHPRFRRPRSTNGRRGAMRVNLKGVHRVRKKLATGLYATYYYAWRGGPRIEAKFGPPEFHPAYVAAHNER